MIYEINHVGIRTPDMERVLAFFAAFDAQVVFDRTIPDAQIRIVYLQLGDGLVEFIGVPAEAGSRGGIDHLAFLSDDIDTDHARLLEAGAVEATAPKPAGTGVGRISFVMLGEARLELLERDLDMRRPVPAGGLVAALDHFSMTTPDLAAATSFFSDVLGLAPLGQIVADGTVIRRYLGLKADAVGLGAAGTEVGPGAFPCLTLRVDDVDAVLAELARRGLTGLGTAEDSRAGTGRRAMIQAPDGVLLELLDRAPLTAGAHLTD